MKSDAVAKINKMILENQVALSDLRFELANMSHAELIDRDSYMAMRTRVDVAKESLRVVGKWLNDD